MANNLDKECQNLLNNMVSMRLCSKEQASELWQKWNDKKSQSVVQPSQFLLQHNIPMSHIQKVMEHRKNVTTALHIQGKNSPTTTTSTSSDVVQANNKLALEIQKEGKVESSVLMKMLSECNRQQNNLGQSLVKGKCLEMSDLVRIINNISQSGSGAKTQRLDDTSAVTANVGGGLQTSTSGDSTFGKYKILGEIARGGMGIVYRAELPEMKRIVALKVLLSGPSAESSQIKRFFREAKATATVEHPNVIPIYDMGEEDGRNYFTMKYVPGTTYQEVINDEEKYSLEQKLQMFTKICSALAKAHDHKILHRDIKPSNILVDEEDEPYLTDFGLAKFIDSDSALTQTGTAVGTPFYMAPEQVKGQKRNVDHRSDIYSMGIVMYQILAKQLPFQAETITELYRRICEEEPIPPKKYNTSIPNNLNAICLKAIEKSKVQRYQSIADMIKDIERHYRGEKVHARKLNLKVMSRRFYRHNQKVIFIVGVLFVITLATLGGWLWMEREASQKNVEKQLAVSDGQKLFRDRKYSKAVKSLKSTVQKFPDFAEAHLLLARVYQKLDNHSLATDHYQQAQKLSQDDPKVLFHQANFYHLQKQNKKALKLVNLCIKKRDNFSEYYRLRSRIYYTLSKIKLADKDNQKAKKLENENLKKLLTRANLLIAKNEVGQALAIFEEILNDYPNFEAAYITRAQLYRQRNDLTNALQDISRAVELNPSFDNYMTRGKWLIAGGYTKEAAKNFASALPKFTEQDQRKPILTYLAQQQFILKQYQNAYKSYFELDHNEENILSRLIECSFYLKKYQQCLDYIKKTLSSSSSNVNRSKAFYYCGIIAVKQKNVKGAVSYLKKSLKLGTDLGKANYYLGKMYFARKKFTQAGKYLQAAVKQSPNDIKTLELIAAYSLRQKQYKQAKEYYSRCIERYPWEAQYYLKRGKACSKLKDYVTSEKDYLKCMELDQQNFVPILSVIDDYFEASFLDHAQSTLDQINIFARRFDENIDLELFDQEFRKTILKYIQITDSPVVEQQKWDEQRAQVFINSLINSDSPAVLDMAQSALTSMYRHTQLLEVIEKNIEQTSLPGAIKRLENVVIKIRNLCIEDEKVPVRQLLVRYYGTKDQAALVKLYQKRKTSIDVLNKLLEDNEDLTIRFLAARALSDLKTRRAQRTLKQATQSENLIARLFSSAILYDGGYKIKSSEPFLEIKAQHDPFVRAIAARSMPAKEHQQLKIFLKDKDLRVRLYAARHLRIYGDLSGTEILLKNFSHKNPLIRYYVQAVFWTFKSIKRKRSRSVAESIKREAIKKHYDKLLKGTFDSNSQVARISLLRVGQLQAPTAGEDLKKLLAVKDERIRFQAILALGDQKNRQSVTAIVSNPKESILFRCAGLIGVHASNRDFKHSEVLSIFPLTTDPDLRIRTLTLLLMTQHAPEAGVKLVGGQLRPEGDQLPVLLALFGRGNKGHIKTLKKLLKHKDIKVQRVAVGNLTYIYAKYRPEKLKEWQQNMKKLPKHIRHGIAMGYSADLGRLLVRISQKYIKDLSRANTLTQQHLYEASVKKMIGELKSSKNNQKILSLLGSINKSIEFRPNYHKYYFSKGIFLYLLNRYQSSVENINKAIKINPEYTVYRLWLAKVYFAMGKPHKALNAIKELEELLPWNIDVLRYKIKILTKLGKKKKIEETSERILLIQKVGRIITE